MLEQKKKQAILFLTNKSDDLIIGLFDDLIKDVGELFDVIILYHKTTDIPESVTKRPHFPFTNENIYTDLGFPVYIDNNFFNGCGHFPLFWFMLNNKEYSHYWLIEDDVRFTGNWKDFFVTLPDNYDFLTSLIRYENQDSNWYWRYSFLFEDGTVVPDSYMQKVASFNTIYRLSNEAMVFLVEKYRVDHFRGHHELTMATLLYNNNFKLGDFGEQGDFVMPELVKPFYNYKTNLFRPPFRSLEELTIQNYIFHPVKST